MGKRIRGANTLVALTAAAVLLVGGVVGAVAQEHPGNGNGRGGAANVERGNSGVQPGNGGQSGPSSDGSNDGPGRGNGGDHGNGNGANPGADANAGSDTNPGLGSEHGRGNGAGPSSDDDGSADVVSPATVTTAAEVTGAAQPNVEGEGEGNACPSNVTTLDAAKTFTGWRNHGEFVSCVARGFITDVSVDDAAQSDVGKQNDNDGGPDAD